MSTYYVYGNTLIPNTLARSTDVKAEFQGIETGLAMLPEPTHIKLGTVQYGTESGAANAYVVTLPYPPGAYTAGMIVVFKATNSNTGGSTVNVNGLGVKAIKRPDGAALVATDITSSTITTLVYNGTDFIVTNGLPKVASDSAASAAAALASELAAAASEAASALSESNAAASEAAAALSESNAASSASTATTQAGIATTQASTATTQAGIATTQAGIATTKASEASASASAASISEGNAATSETNAAASAASAATSYDNFDDRYLGQKASDPTLDNDGAALLTGALYFNTTTNRMRVYSGTSWGDVGSSTADVFEYTAIAGQTSFSGTDINGKAMTYQVGFVEVFLNGVRLDKADYTATTGTTVVLDTGATVGDTLSVLAFGTFNVADAYTKAQTDANFAPITRSRRNLFINGNFDLWQRGTSHTTNGYGSADRWFNGLAGAGATATMARAQWNNPNTCYSQTGISGTNFMRVTFVSGGTAGEQIAISQRIEDVAFTAGKTVTVSFWAKASAAGMYLTHESYQSFGTGGTPSAAVSAIGVHKFALTTGWARYSHTFTVPDTSTKTLGTNDDHKLVVHFWMSSGSDFNARSDTLGFQSGYIDFAGMQFEVGDTATNFENRQVVEELALCQRYFIAYYPTTWPYLYSGGASGSYHAFVRTLPVTMRATPTFTIVGTPTYTNCSALTLTGSNKDVAGYVTTTAAGVYRVTSFTFTADADF